MRQDYCVEIFADGSYGSGYAMTETAVLTARHVVVDKRTGKLFQNLRVRLVQDYRNGKNKGQDPTPFKLYAVKLP